MEKPFTEKRWKNQNRPRMGSGNEAKTLEILTKWKATRRRLRRRPLGLCCLPFGQDFLCFCFTSGAHSGPIFLEIDRSLEKFWICSGSRTGPIMDLKIAFFFSPKFPPRESSKNSKNHTKEQFARNWLSKLKTKIH